MTRLVEHGTFQRSCGECGWAGTYATEGRADYAKRRHSCARHIARAAKAERGRQRMATVDRTPKPCLHERATHVHGTYACYTLDRCRCEPCRDATTAYEQARKRRHAYGRWDHWTDAEPVRAHVRELMANGMGHRRIALAAGIAPSNMWRLLYGKRRPDGTRTPAARIRTENAERFLAIELDLADHAFIDVDDSVGARRRLRALVALGWSQSKLADRLGATPNAVNAIIHGEGGTTAGRQRAIEELYDELSMTLPPADEWRDKIAASRSRNYAKARGWLPPLALDDDALDDVADYTHLELEDDGPVIDEAAIMRRSTGDRSVELTRDERRELVTRLHAQGLNDVEIRTRTGYATDTVLRDRQHLGLAPNLYESVIPMRDRRAAS